MAVRNETRYDDMTFSASAVSSGLVRWRIALPPADQAPGILAASGGLGMLRGTLMLLPPQMPSYPPCEPRIVEVSGDFWSLFRAHTSFKVSVKVLECLEVESLASCGTSYTPWFSCSWLFRPGSLGSWNLFQNLDRMTAAQCG